MGAESESGGALPPPPSTTPAGNAPAATAATPCVGCRGRPCTNGRRGWTEYGCWCGADVAPARAANLEGSIPPNEADWAKWVDDNNLPRAEDGTDACCLTHDLELGRLRQTHPDLQYNSNSPHVAAINSRLARCFAQNKNAPGSQGWFAWRGEKAMNYLVNNSNGGVPGMAGAAEARSLSPGYGAVGMGSANTGALGSLVGQ